MASPFCRTGLRCGGHWYATERTVTPIITPLSALQISSCHQITVWTVGILMIICSRRVETGTYHLPYPLWVDESCHAFANTVSFQLYVELAINLLRGRPSTHQCTSPAAISSGCLQQTSYSSSTKSTARPSCVCCVRIIGVKNVLTFFILVTVCYIYIENNLQGNVISTALAKRKKFQAYLDVINLSKKAFKVKPKGNLHSLWSAVA